MEYYTFYFIAQDKAVTNVCYQGSLFVYTLVITILLGRGKIVNTSSTKCNSLPKSGIFKIYHNKQYFDISDIVIARDHCNSKYQQNFVHNVMKECSTVTD